jgi:glycosyltransferase involved in cell wall biosynthesis
MEISIVIPAYNEAERIEKTLEAYAKFFRAKVKSKELKRFEVLVVLNGCSDNTLEIVKKMHKKHKEVIFLDFKQGGKGFAILEGFKDAFKRKFSLIGFVDADLATSPEAFYELLTNMESYDGIIGSRWLKESNVKTRQPLLRIIMSRGFNTIVRTLLLFPYKDTQCGAKIFTLDSLKKVDPMIHHTQWAFDIELLYHLRKQGFKIREFPTTWEDRKGSKLNVTNVPMQMFLAVVRIRIIHSPFRKLVNMYDQLPKKLKIHKIRI